MVTDNQNYVLATVLKDNILVVDDQDLVKKLEVFNVNVDLEITFNLEASKIDWFDRIEEIQDDPNLKIVTYHGNVGTDHNFERTDNLDINNVTH